MSSHHDHITRRRRCVTHAERYKLMIFAPCMFNTCCECLYADIEDHQGDGMIHEEVGGVGRATGAGNGGGSNDGSEQEPSEESVCPIPRGHCLTHQERLEIMRSAECLKNVCCSCFTKARDLLLSKRNEEQDQGHDIGRKRMRRNDEDMSPQF